MSSRLDATDQLIPEWASFRAAVTSRRPEHGTACAAWTVRDIVAHNAGNAEELARVLSSHLGGGPVPPTRTFEEREPRFRELANADLFDALDREVQHLAAVLEEASRTDGEQLVPWTGRHMKVAWFGEHMREELILHRWDVAGDDDTSARLLGQPWVTEHSVVAVGKPLLRKGLSQLTAGRVREARLRSPGRDDVIISAGPDTTAIELGPPVGPAVLESDPAARVLLLWGRQPSDSSRLNSTAGPEALGQARLLLSGY